MDYAGFVDFLSFTATASTIVMFLCGLQICSRIRKRGFIIGFLVVWSLGPNPGFGRGPWPVLEGLFVYAFFQTEIYETQIFGVQISTDGTGVAPFFLTAVSCICWLGYGILRRDQTVIFVNGVGLVFQTIYLTYYYVHTRLKARLNRLIFLEMVVSVLTTFLINGQLLNEKEKENFLGIICMFLNIATIASPLVDVGQVLRTKSTESLPFMLCLSNLAVTVQWLLYGFLVDDFYMKVPNAIGTFISTLQLSLFMVYPRTYKQLVVGQV